MQNRPLPYGRGSDELYCFSQTNEVVDLLTLRIGTALDGVPSFSIRRDDPLFGCQFLSRQVRDALDGVAVNAPERDGLSRDRPGPRLDSRIFLAIETGAVLDVQLLSPGIQKFDGDL